MKIIKKVWNKVLRTIFRKNKKMYVSLQFENSIGHKPNLKEPKSLNEKICYLKLNYYNPLYEKCTDKYNVREYVESKGLKNILVKLYGVYNNFDEIDFDKLPDKFVLKTTHSCGGVVVVKDKSKMNIEETRKILENSLKRNIYPLGYEWQYKNLVPRIVAEELIETNNKELIDYKFFCFDGKPHYVYLAEGTESGDDNYCIDYYDMDFNWVDVKKSTHKNFGEREKPNMFEELKEVASKLSEDFAFVRVDLYCENGKIYFGELTFTPGNGINKYTPESFDYELGKLFDINKLK